MADYFLMMDPGEVFLTMSTEPATKGLVRKWRVRDDGILEVVE